MVGRELFIGPSYYHDYWWPADADKQETWYCWLSRIFWFLRQKGYRVITLAKKNSEISWDCSIDQSIQIQNSNSKNLFASTGSKHEMWCYHDYECWRQSCLWISATWLQSVTWDGDYCSYNHSFPHYENYQFRNSTCYIRWITFIIDECYRTWVAMTLIQ